MLSATDVAAASAAWMWAPDDAEVVEGDGFTLVRLPEHFAWDLSVLAFTPTGSGPLGAAVDAVIERARAFEVPVLDWEVGLGAPAGLAGELTARGGQVKLTLEVLARDLGQEIPVLPPPTADLTVRWATDFETARDGSAVAVVGFGGELPPDEQIEAAAAKYAAAVPAGGGGMLVAYVDGAPVGFGGLSLVDGVARLSGGVVVPAERGRGIYRALVESRLSYAVAHGARMALVKGNVVTSAPILRKAGFTSFGQEPIYAVPLS
ncbi:GNAT family N-acetyltransferase [Kitasatospora viridis]|uniref:Acetyltransferase (GNAT) family protein n=2 Tax=Kitasatospora viridis TaxID=281105 RepID=A0A561TWF9_9ACTN|nr:GNAT family N-acetyltransferase [Kitasatospora viridis]TWF91424.1 acetyltransferase (GNAT) family protein [Kitasatospora viridis]